MVTFREALTRAATTFLCGAIDTIAEAYNIFGDLLEPFPAAERYQTAAYIIRNICNSIPPPSPDQLPFTGGQCTNLNYRIDMNITENFDNNQVSTVTRTVFPNREGRIGGIKLIPKTGNIQGTDTPAQIELLYGVGTLPAPGGAGVTIRAPAGSFPVTRQNFVVINSITLIPLNRSTGAQLPASADNCGNPPPPSAVPPPPAGFNRNVTNITYQNPQGTNITIPVGFFLAQAFFDANLNLTIPVNVTFDFNVSFPINFNFSTGGITFDFRPSSGFPTAPPPSLPPPPPGLPESNDFEFETPPPPPPPDPEFQPPPPPPDGQERRVIRGVIVDVDIDAQGKVGVIFQEGGNPDIFIPDLGRVSFQILIGNTVSWTQDLPVKNERCFIPCPWEGGAIAVRGSGRPGIDLELTPVYAKSGLEF